MPEAQQNDPEVQVFTEEIPDSPQEVRQHRCKVCGKVVFEFYKTADGREVIIVQCHGVRQVVKPNGQPFTTRCKTKHWVTIAEK